MKFKGQKILLVGLILLSGGAALRARWGAVRATTFEDSLPGMVGGYRFFAADIFWLKANLAWETKDAVQVRQLMNFTVTVDPQTPYFWLNSARILAYDFPAWKCEYEAKAPMAVQARWRVTAAGEALNLLERGQYWHGKSAVLHLEMANICLYALGDRARAAEYYRLASEQADAPEYAARIYARLCEEGAAGMPLTR